MISNNDWRVASGSGFFYAFPGLPGQFFGGQVQFVRRGVSNPYFPVDSNYSWIYQGNGASFTRTVLPGVFTINGVATKALADDNGFVQYFTNDGYGIRLHRQFQPHVDIGLGIPVDLEITFSPPVILADATMTVPKTVVSSGTARTNNLPQVGVLTLAYSASFTAQTFETITVPAGSFDAVKLQGSVNIAGEVVYETLYLANYIGPVKIVDTSEGITETAELFAVHVDGGSYSEGQAQYADLNGDAKADLIFHDVDNNFWVALSTGTDFTLPTLWVDHGGAFLPGQAQYADLNGDGQADLIFQGVDNNFWASLSTGTDFTLPTLWLDHGGAFLPGQAQYADVNSDGKADLIFQGVDNAFWVSLSTGTGFTSPTLWIDHGGSFLEGQAQYADLNGDGQADLIFQGVDNAFWVSLSTGTGFTSPSPWIQHGGAFLKGQAQYADLNGDGQADLIFQGVDNAFWVSLSTGTGFTSPTLWVDHGGSFLEGQAQYADVNGDGKVDLIFQGVDNIFWVSLSSGTGLAAPVRWP